MFKIALLIIILPFSIIRCHSKPDSLAKNVDSSSIQFKLSKAINDYLPEVKKIAKETVGPVAKDVLQNDDAMYFTFRGLYELLPFPVKWAIKKEDFISYCLDNRYVLIDQLPDKPITQKESK